MDVKIVSPSIGRANNVITKQVVEDLIIVCPESQADQYAEFSPHNEVVAHPEDCRGISAVRQWIIENFGNVFMLDDDIHGVHNLYRCEGETYVMNRDQVRDIILQNFDVAKQLGVYYWGFTNMRRPVQYYPQNPFSLVGYINGSNIGFLEGHNLSYDQRISDADDYYMACLNVYKNRKMFIDNRFAFNTKDNFTASGGASGYRNSETIENDTLLLRQLFGDVIQLKKKTTFKLNVIEGERFLKFPI
jgi:hypothetical protein